ncbi:UDP-4-amino-4,6-dideoxy-N-acetyl-beta-L-altrosamine transaminase [Candidatus Kaiserbacteria bacterium]|nr:UDP-4-amino-4,6-dideoxy-N-acetyl-beta-L-altrosamine transaminase [Candidatus Kaiserbacteria bacterium]
MIPYSRQDIDERDIKAVSRTMRSDWLTQGPETEKFERSLAGYCGAKYAIAVANGTAALHAAYVAAGIKKGDEVITTPLTFSATSNMALAVGAKVIFADIDEKTGNLNPAEVARKITKRTKAIVVVDYGGNPVDLRAFRALAKKHSLVLIEDAAQALGATYRGRKIGSVADMTTFSFHPVKSITTGEGGAILTDRKDYADTLRLFRTHGIRKGNPKHPAWHQEMLLLGFNYRLTDMQAALGSSQLRRLNTFITKRRAAASRYFKLLKGSRLILPPEDSLRSSAWHLFPIRISRGQVKRRDEVFAGMRRRGIGVQVHHVPVHLHPYYRSLGYKKGLCPKAEQFAASEISLPLYPSITEREQRFIVKTLLQLLG